MLISPDHSDSTKEHHHQYCSCLAYIPWFLPPLRTALKLVLDGKLGNVCIEGEKPGVCDCVEFLAELVVPPLEQVLLLVQVVRCCHVSDCYPLRRRPTEKKKIKINNS
jgi:hypothetical protein